MDAKDPRPLVLVTVGMDHHRFDRLMDWVDAWLEGGGGDKVRCLVQYGSSSRPRLAELRDFLDYAELQATLMEAAVVVCHAGGGTPMMCLWIGRKPILVPRLAKLREAVDDHQVVFARKLAAEGQAFVAEDRDAFFRALDEVVSGAQSAEVSTDQAHVAQSLLLFERLVSPLLPGSFATGSPRVWP